MFYTQQFGVKAVTNTSTAGKTSSEAESEQTQVETTVPEDITAFYDKIDKEDEDDEEEQQLKTVSFEVNQVCIWFNYVILHTYVCIGHSKIFYIKTARFYK